MVLESDYDYALYRINETLKKADVENKDGIVSFYDMIEYGKRGLKDLVEVTNPKSNLAKEINKSNPINLVVNNCYTKVKTERSYIDNICIYTIKIIPSMTGSIILTKYKGVPSISIEPYTEKNRSLVKKHLDTIKATFNTLEKYSNLFCSINGSEYCHIRVYEYDSLFYVRLYYNDYGQIQTEIRLSHKYDIEQKFNNKKTLKEILEKNKEQLLKKCQLI